MPELHPLESGADSKYQAARTALLRMQRELHLLLRVHEETNRKIRTVDIVLRWPENSYGAPVSRIPPFGSNLALAQKNRHWKKDQICGSDVTAFSFGFRYCVDSG